MQKDELTVGILVKRIYNRTPPIPCVIKRISFCAGCGVNHYYYHKLDLPPDDELDKLSMGLHPDSFRKYNT